VKLSSLVSTTGFKLSALYLGLFLCSFLAIGTTVYLLTTHSLEQQLRNNLESEIARLKTEYKSGGLPELIDEINEVIDSKSNHALEYGVLNQNGQLIAGSLSQFKLAEGWQILKLNRPINKTANEKALFLVRIIALPNHIWLGVGHDSGNINDAGEAIIQAFLWGFGLVIVLGIMGGIYISHAFLTKIDRITQSTQAIIAGDLSHRLTVSKNQDELDNLAFLLNRMLDKMGTLIANVQQVSNDIAHDLRTPVSRLKFRLEAALMSNLSEEQYKEQIASAITEADTILETFSALLRISQIESQSRRSGFKMINLSDIVIAVVDALNPAAEEQGKIIAFDIEQACELYGDKELMTQLVFNLLENAIVHTPEHSGITVNLRAFDDWVELIIADHGPGITEAQRQKVFQRFYRLEQSRTRPGNGLGLSIVAAIVDLHNGKIVLSDNYPGLKAVLNFRKKTDQFTSV
jgi:signal transduction histidine kinase